MPDAPDPKLADEAKRIATDAVDAVESLAHSAVNLPADTARLALNALRAAVQKVEDAVNRVTR